MEQKLAKKDPDGIVRETHVYKGPQGEGFITYEYKMNGEQLEVKAEHTGPEARTVPETWTVIPDADSFQTVQTGTEPKVIDEVIVAEETKNGKKKQVEKIERKTVDVPVYEEQPIVIKHPYKDKFFGGI